MESINNVCRLCSSTKDLEYLYDREFVGDKNIDFKDAVLTVTGILILSNDKVSQKICTTCFQTTSEMFQFRVKSRKNDKLLKAQYNDLFKKSGGEQEKPLVLEGIRESKDDFLKKFVSELGNPFELKGIEESSDDCLKKSGSELENPLELKGIEESYDDLLEKSGRELKKPLVLKGIRESKDDFLKKSGSELENPLELKRKEESNDDCLEKSGGELKKFLELEGKGESNDDFLQKFASEVGNPLEPKGMEESNDNCLKKSGSQLKNPLELKGIEESYDDLLKKSSGELEKLLELEVIEESTELKKVPEPMEKINEDADEVLEKYPAIMSLLANDSDVSLSVLLRINQPSVSNPEKNRDGKSIIESNPILNDLLNSKTQRKGNIFGPALEPSYKCHICGLARYTPRSLERHMRKHMHCKLCETTFRSMEMTLMHIENYCRAKKIDEYDRYKERENLNLKELEICFAKFCT